MPKSSKKPAKAPRAGPKHPVAAKARKLMVSTEPTSNLRENTKQAKLIAMLRRPGGATIDDLAKATGWQAHSIRGVISSTLKKKLGLAVVSEKTSEEDRIYRLP